MMTVDLFEVLDTVWQTLCIDYDVCAYLPDIGDILKNVETTLPEQAAQSILTNLLSEIMENTNRFSPWYKKPARAFGVEFRVGSTGGRQWTLTPEAIAARHHTLALLTRAVERNATVILATHFLDDLAPPQEIADPCQSASCQCIPPRIILIQNAPKHYTTIVCDSCRQPFIRM